MVSAADPRAAAAGAEILRQGGSATDAALATLLALTVVEPQSSGIGGGGFLLVDDGSGKVDTLDGRETAPMAAGPEWFFVDGKPMSVIQAIPGGKSVGVPGNLRLMAQAHQQHGKLPWAALFQPAIRLARDGYVMTPRLQCLPGPVQDHRRAFSARPRDLLSGRWLHPAASRNHDPQPGAGDLPGAARQPGCGQLLRRPQCGRDCQRSQHRAAQSGGDDHRRYRRIRCQDRANRFAPPIASTESAGWPPPSSGATTVLGVLGLLEKFDLRGLGKDDLRAWHLIAEAQRLAYADRERYLADPDFVSVPVAGLLAPDYLAARAAADRH